MQKYFSPDFPLSFNFHFIRRCSPTPDPVTGVNAPWSGCTHPDEIGKNVYMGCKNNFEFGYNRHIYILLNNSSRYCRFCRQFKSHSYRTRCVKNMKILGK